MIVFARLVFSESPEEKTKKYPATTPERAARIGIRYRSTLEIARRITSMLVTESTGSALEGNGHIFTVSRQKSGEEISFEQAANTQEMVNIPRRERTMMRVACIFAIGKIRRTILAYHTWGQNSNILLFYTLSIQCANWKWFPVSMIDFAYYTHTMDIINTLLLILAVVIIIAVMLQSRGNGLSIVPTSNDFGKFERRGPEKILYQGTALLI